VSQQFPIDTLDLFPVLDEKLLAFLRGLTPSEWERQTLAPHWKVMDVALHLLDGNLRALSLLRDGYAGIKPTGDLSNYQELVGFLNQLNADWVAAARRLSPAVVLWLLELTGREYTAFLHTLDLWQPAAFAVAWAGEEQSSNWFHIAREYTEKWHHQQQIRYAVGRGEAELLEPELYGPYLETSMQALPHHYRNVDAPVGTVLRLIVTANTPYEWRLRREAASWCFTTNDSVAPTTTVRIDGPAAWRLLSNELDAPAAARHISTVGEARFGERILDLVAVMV
jgi:hypothetical protein